MPINYILIYKIAQVIQMSSFRQPIFSISSAKQTLLMVLIIVSCIAQQADPNPAHIQSKKYSAISGEEANAKVTPQRVNYTIPYGRAFKRKPDVGLSVYNMQFDYNPEFSINVIQETSNSSTLQFYVAGRPSDSNIFNELFIMYIASDYDLVGIYMPGPKNTVAKLGNPSESGEKSEDFVFNFKSIDRSPIFTAATIQSNIRVSVYLTGITAFSQTISNGYSRNYGYFSLSVHNVNYQFYTIRVKVKSSNGDVLIKSIQFTVVYFDITAVAAEYQMNSNTVLATNFGGTFFKSSFSTPLASLPEDNRYENTLQYFFGISEIECSEGQTINILAVQRFNYNNNGKLQNLVLTFQTQRNTYILRGEYNYIQYKPRTCNNSASCGIPCDNSTGIYRISNLQNRCAPCTYFCTSCDNGFNCTTCPVSRKLDQTGICTCVNNTLFDKPPNKECLSCFDNKYCWTCDREGVCLSCSSQFSFTFNNVLRTCECSAGSYDSVGSTSGLTNLKSRASTICLSCPAKCIYCTSQTSCQACQLTTYLALSAKQIEGKNQTCTPICTSTQQLSLARKCLDYKGDTSLFNSAGRLGFEWDYKNANNELVVDLVFSQANMTYYFYENGNGYTYTKVTTDQNRRNDQGQASVYNDDGNGYINGYAGRGSTSFTSSVINTKVTKQSGVFDPTALQGKYYGLGQASFYQQQYKSLKPQAQYFDQFGIPFGKHQLRSTTISDSATYLDAIRNNMQFLINGQSMAYTLKGISANQFQLTVRPEKSYLTSNASIVFKNPALVRSGETALQTPMVSKQLDRLDRYSLSQLSIASSLRDRTATIVQILWGICKYILFLGFGWAVMPLMLILQYIFGHNYISSQLPLNLEYFLASFADFRNPSILFNPQRNQFDASVVNHGEIYKRVASYEQFDRGIDFMKNSFQFFFVPLLSFGLQFLLIGINFLVNKLCSRQIPIISKYLQPRLLHHAAAYTLVQALPISFFFFGQLQDQRYHSVNSPNQIYPSFNAGISYASFFASIFIPIILLVFIYNFFKNRARSGLYQVAKVQGQASTEPAMLGDPLWGGNPYNTFSYGFSAVMFFLPLLAGFVLSFFTKAYAWQLTGLLLGFLGLTGFAAASSHFDSKITKYFFVGIGLLMIAYELVHAGIGSNRALKTNDQWNTGYLGIGIIYALLLAGIIFSGYLIYKLISNIYKNLIKTMDCLPKLVKQGPSLKTVQEEQLKLRDNVLGRREHRQNTQMKSRLNYFNPQYTQDRLINQGNKQQILGDINLADNKQLYRQDFQFLGVKNDGLAMFKAANSGQQYIFPFWSSQILTQNLPLTIDSKQNIFRKNDSEQVGTIRQFLKQKTSQTQFDLMMNTNKKPNTSKSIQLQGGLEKQKSRHMQEALNIVKVNQNNNNFISMKMNGQNIAYKKDDQDSDFYVVAANGKAEQRVSKKQFLNQLMKNNNMISYNGEDYILSKGGVDDDEEQFFFMESPKTKALFKVTEKEVFDIFAAQSQQSQAQALTQNKAQSQALLNQLSLTNNANTNFNKLGGIVDQNSSYYRAGSSNQGIEMNKSAGQQYLINGSTYIKIGEDAQNYYLKDILTEQQVLIKREQANAILAAANKANTEEIGEVKSSLKQMVENRLSQDQGNLQYQNQRHRFTGMVNGRYSFASVVNNNIIYLSVEELGEVYGFQKVSNVVQNNYRIQMPRNTTKLTMYKYDSENTCYIYEDPRNQERYQMPFEWIDINQAVYIDEKNNFWHRGEIIGGQQSQSINSRMRLNSQNVINNQMVVNMNMNGHNIIPSNKTITSSASLSSALNPTEVYTIQFLSPDYKLGSVASLPSQKDIIDLKENVMGVNVMKVVETVRSIYPNCKALIESARFPSQKFLLE